MPRFAHLILRVLVALLVVLAAAPVAPATALSFGTELASPPTARSAKREDGLGGDGGAKRRRGGALDNFEGELLEVENEEGEVHHLDRDINGLLVAERTFDDRHLRYTNDLLGRTVLVANGAGELTELQYDAASQTVLVDADWATIEKADRRWWRERSTTAPRRPSPTTSVASW